MTGLSPKQLALTLLILLVSLIYGLPNIILSQKLGRDYQPLVINKDSPIAKDETYAYAPFVKHILEGNLLVREVYVKEYQNFPTLFLGESLPALILAFLAILTGSLASAFIVADFIFPPMIFLLLYHISRIFIKNFWFAASTAFLTVIARDFISVVPYPYDLLQYFTVAEQRNFFLYFSRAFHPQITFVFFAAAFIALVKVLSFPNKKTPIIALGLFFGLLFYSYVFYWTYFLAFFALISVFFLLERKFQIVKSLFFSGALASLIGLPYFLNMYRFYQLDLAHDFVTKSSLQYLDLPITLLRYFAIALIFWVVTKLKDYKFFCLFLFILTGVSIPIISKIIIGQDLETLHYLRRAMIPFATIALFTVFYTLFFKNSKIIYLTAVAVFIAATFLGFKTQIVTANTVSQYHKLDNNLQAVFQWLNDNSQKDDVVGSIDTFFSRYLSVYTENYVFFPPTDRTVTPTYEGVERYIILANLLGIDPTWQKQNLVNTLSYMFIYQAYSQGIGLDYNSPKKLWTENQIEEHRNDNPADSLEKYQLDFIVVTPHERKVVNPQAGSMLVQRAAFGDYLIYQVSKR